jgi:dihydroorotate dehydrogenase (NAD+) catalytic subunit
MPKSDLYLSTPFLNAAGTLGFSPDPKTPLDITQLGAFVTNPVSLAPRKPAKGDRYLPFPGGFLLHTGYPNPGFKTIIRKHARRWARSPVPVIVHLLAQEPTGLRRMVERLEGIEAVMGVEIGLRPGIDPDLVHEMGMAAVGELASIIRLPFDSVSGVNVNAKLLDTVIATGASAVSLAPPRGTLVGADGSLVSGRLFGPGLFPQTLAAVKILAEMDIPTIGGGGVYSRAEVETLLAAGAVAVQLDAVLWRGGFQF